MTCLHCGGSLEVTPPHMCEDRDRWSQAERDEWRRQARARHPFIQFAPSTEEMARRFGAYSAR